jgi:hypothetical protein
MTSSPPNTTQISVRSVQYRDVEAINALVAQWVDRETSQSSMSVDRELLQIGSWYGLKRFLSLLPHSYYHGWRIYVAEQQQQLLGLIQVTSVNSTRSTWRVERVLLDSSSQQLEVLLNQQEIGSQLLRYCLAKIWEARTWILEVNVNEKNHLALYRENGFQPLAQMTYWQLPPDLLAELAKQEVDLPNLLPVSNADAPLLYQLDCVSMPPLLRQVFDRHVDDFKSSLIQTTVAQIRHWLNGIEVIKGYVFEPQRKAAIGYFKLECSKDASRPHRAQLTVNPAYTWLYPQLIAQMAKITQNGRRQSLELASADYQPEREEYLSKIGASPVEHTLLMSRSVWHKIKESRPLEGLQLSEVLQGLKPARTPIPSRISWLRSMSESYQSTVKNKDIFTPGEGLGNLEDKGNSESSEATGNGHHA